MVGFAPCDRCGVPFCEHQLGPQHGRDDAPAAPATDERAARRARLVSRAEAVYDEIDRLVVYYVRNPWARDRNERITRRDMRARFAVKLVELLRELEQVRRRP